MNHPYRSPSARLRPVERASAVAWIPVWIAAVVVLLDQATKWGVSRLIRLHDSVVVIPGLFNLTHVWNRGAAFGLFSDRGSTFRLVFFVVVSVVALVVLIYLIARLPARDGLAGIAFGLILGGAVGNLIDRARFGAVMDFLEFYLGPFHWPAFNMADSSITIGMLFLVGRFLLEHRRADRVRA